MLDEVDDVCSVSVEVVSGTVECDKTSRNLVLCRSEVDLTVSSDYSIVSGKAVSVHEVSSCEGSTKYHVTSYSDRGTVGFVKKSKLSLEVL